jgi:hypothetical protein
LTPTGYQPAKGVTINPENGLFFPPVMMGQRDLNIFPLYGEYKFAGAIDGPLFPSNSIPLLVAAIGADGGRAGITSASQTGQGVTGSVGNGKNGTLGVLTAGATTATYTLVGGAAPVTGEFYQIESANAVNKVTEVRKLTNVTGGGPYTLTFDVAINYNHVAATPCTNVVAPYTHSIVQQNLLDSLTIEKAVGGFQSEQYAGCRIAKFGTKIAAGNTEAEFTADVVAQNWAVLGSPSAVAVTNEAPFTFAEATLALYGTNRLEAKSVSIDIENGLKETYTLAGQHQVQYLTPVTRKVTGQLQFVFSSLNDATYGYFNHLLNQSGGTETPGALSLQFLHPGSGGNGVTISLNKAALKKYQDDIKMEDVVLATVDYEAYLDLTASPVKTLGATVINGVYLPY